MRLFNSEKASTILSEIQRVEDQQAVRLILTGIEQFFLEQPSQLHSGFDLAFVTTVLRERVGFLRESLQNDWHGWWDEGEFPKTHPIQDPMADVSSRGMRERQAGNFIATLDYDRRLQAALLVIKAWAFANKAHTPKTWTVLVMRPFRPASRWIFCFLLWLSGTVCDRAKPQEHSWRVLPVPTDDVPH